MALTEPRLKMSSRSRGGASLFGSEVRKERLASRNFVPVEFKVERDLFFWDASGNRKAYIRRVEAQARRPINAATEINSKVETLEAVPLGANEDTGSHTLIAFTTFALIFGFFSSILSLIGFIYALSLEAFSLLPVTLGGAIFFLIVSGIFLKLKLKLNDRSTEDNFRGQSGVLI
jgi:hypothetical protein